MRPRLSGLSSARLDRVLERLSDPLQLAVAGRLKAGKSTVVNALIGRRVAATDVRECTRLVTRFRYGPVDRVEVVGTDGGRYAVPFDGDGVVPTELGLPIDRIAYLDAFCTSAALRSVTIIDTPGPGPAGAARGHRSRTALDRAEAVLYVFTQTARVDDARALTGFRARTVPGLASPINAIGVLNKADLLDAPEPISAARSLAASQARALRQQLRTVLPLAGLLAETTATGCLTEADGEVLRQLAALAPGRRELLLGSADLFVRPDPAIAVAVAGRLRLLERLDLFGIRHATDLLAVDAALTTGELRRRLAERSGLAPLRDLVGDAFGCHADGIKANVALTALRHIGRQAATARDRAVIADAVEELAQQPLAHQLRVVAAAALVSSGAVRVPEQLAVELDRLAHGGDPVDQLGAPHLDRRGLAELALRRARAWRAFATAGSSPAQGRIAHVVHRGYVLLWQRLGDAAEAVGTGDPDQDPAP
ncbi:MAG: dynamin family protein [Actinobacteria bacterium]|nr:dynamin family protein [Actinomycetota bacterium]MBI3687323.1 dynamin family protein [Actinomycetota bacterium]